MNAKAIEKIMGHWRVTAYGGEGGVAVTRECVLCGFVVSCNAAHEENWDDFNRAVSASMAEVERHDVLSHPGEELWAQRLHDFRGDLQEALPAAVGSRLAFSYGLELLEWPDTFGRWAG